MAALKDELEKKIVETQTQMTEMVGSIRRLSNELGMLTTSVSKIGEEVNLLKAAIEKLQRESPGNPHASSANVKRYA